MELFSKIRGNGRASNLKIINSLWIHVLQRYLPDLPGEIQGGSGYTGLGYTGYWFCVGTVNLRATVCGQGVCEGISGRESRVRGKGRGMGLEQLAHLLTNTRTWHIPSRTRTWHTSSVQDQTVNAWGLTGHTGCVATTPLCHCSTETARGSSYVSVMALFQYNFSDGL